MHFKRVNRQIRCARYDFVTSDRQISLDMENPCCARGCMTMIGKKKLKDLRHYYFSLNGDEQDTYLSSYMQMVKDTSSSLSISFNVVDQPLRLGSVLAMLDCVQGSTKSSSWRSRYLFRQPSKCERL